MTRTEYEKSVCERLPQAAQVPYREVSFADGSLPVQSDCHRNAERWVRENPGCKVVHGWVTYVDYWIAVGLTAHSVIQNSMGQLFDITPLGSSAARAGMRFVPHVGTEREFMSMKGCGIEIRCPVEN